MADVVDIERAFFFVQAIDNTVAARFERTVAGEIARQFRSLARIVAEIVDRRSYQLFDFGRELGDMACGLGDKADPDHRLTAEDILIRNPLARSSLPDRLLQRFHRRLVAED